jgi:hypothetical protein
MVDSCIVIVLVGLIILFFHRQTSIHLRTCSEFFCMVSVVFFESDKEKNKANMLTENTAPADTAVEYQTIRYNVSTKSNRFVGASPEVDQAWREISYDGQSRSSEKHANCGLQGGTNQSIVGDQWISRTDLERLGMPKTSLMVDHPKTGEQGYRVGVEVFHQLHCLNLLRRVAYREYYEPLGGEFAAGPDALRHHAGKQQKNS